MGDVPSPADLPALVERGLELMAQRLAVDPAFPLWRSIANQLEYVKRTVAAGERPAPEDVDRLTLGVYAAREFETSDPELADVLFTVEYLFKRL
jgi:hypothetical protein